ncbi:MAG TPA: hypothetical protein VMW55_06320 [Nitrosopumilaceae archaeon]|nr:hypothetical protein [Nitrosopumilaceae archaeon]
MKTLVILAIAIVCLVGITAAVLIAGGAYQKVLFDEYLEDIENPTKSSLDTNPNLPKIDIFP